MLVLNRKAGEKLYLGEDVVITVTEVRGGRVRLGIQAPRGLKIYRDELLTAEQRRHLDANREGGEADA